MDPAGREYLYNNLSGRLDSYTDPEGGITRYDDLDRVTIRVQRDSAGNEKLRWTYTYDLGREPAAARRQRRRRRGDDVRIHV